MIIIQEEHYGIPCDICGLIECMCEINVMHDEACPYRKAALLKEECQHGYFACTECDACTCRE